MFTERKQRLKVQTIQPAVGNDEDAVIPMRRFPLEQILRRSDQHLVEDAAIIGSFQNFRRALDLLAIALDRRIDLRSICRQRKYLLLMRRDRPQIGVLLTKRIKENGAAGSPRNFRGI